MSQSSVPQPPFPAKSPPRRFVLVIALVCIAVFVAAWAVYRALSVSAEEAGRQCFEHMFAGRAPESLDALARYRKLLGDEIPKQAEEEVARLGSNPNYPMSIRQADAVFIQRTVALCRVQEFALRRAGDDRRGASIEALHYVLRRLQSAGDGADKTPALGAPVQILLRGYAQPAESAWMMAVLLRLRGIPAAVVQLPAPAALQAPYFLTGVIIEERLYLFDPYRGVPICRASDLAVADVQSLVSGHEQIAPGFGGPGSPVTVDALKEAIYLVPAESEDLIPDAWLVSKLIRENGRRETVYHSFREDLRDLGTSVFGKGTAFIDSFTELTVQGRAEKVALWPYPFVLPRMMSRPEAARAADKVDKRVGAYVVARAAQLQGAAATAWEIYGEVLAEYAGEPEVVEDAAFFRACVAPEPEKLATLTAETRDEFLARCLGEYLEKYPSGRWRSLAGLLLAEKDGEVGRTEQAIRRAAELPPPYDLRGKLFADALRDGRKRIVWSFPEPASLK